MNGSLNGSGFAKKRKVTRLPEFQFSFHFTNHGEEVGIVVLVCVIRQVRPEYFNGVFDTVKFQYFGFFVLRSQSSKHNIQYKYKEEWTQRVPLTNSS